MIKTIAMTSYNWGIIGPGNIAHDFANDMKLVSVPQKITAVLSDHEQSADAFADEFNIGGRFTELEDFAKNSGVDIAYIATPHPLHYEAVKACLQNRIAVLCEKPVTINHIQQKELVQLSKETNTFLMEGMWIRFLPNFRKLIELIDQKKTGDVISVKASMYFKAPRDENSRYYDPAKGGGSLLDLGIYCIFLSTLLMGVPKCIKAVAKLSDKEIDEACAILLSYTGHRYAMLESSLLIRENSPAVIYGSKGIISILNPWFEKSPALVVQMDDGQKENISFSWDGHGLQYEIEEVIKCISEGKIESSLLPASLTCNVLKVMDEIRNQVNVEYKKYE
jgi:predicted dehydrogenase